MPESARGRRAEEFQTNVVWVAEAKHVARCNVDDRREHDAMVSQRLLPSLQMIAAQDEKRNVVQTSPHLIEGGAIGLLAMVETDCERQVIAAKHASHGRVGYWSLRRRL
jgi:hypothetical protein